MTTSGLNRIRSFLLAGSLFFLLPAAQADTDAVTPLANGFIGYLNGAAGFTFSPTTHLVVTRVGYLYSGNVNPIVTFWAGTNYPMASFPLAPGTNSDTMVYSNVSLTLLAGQSYSITLQDGPLSTSLILPRAYLTNSVGFQVANQLAGYQGLTVTTAGVFANFSSDALYLGPNFSYQIQTTPITLPVLSISPGTTDTAVISWPSPSPGFLLAEIPDLAATNWTLVTNTVNVASTTYEVVVSSLTSNRFYRLFHP